MRGLARTFGVSRGTVTAWLKKASQLSPLSQTLVQAQTDDVLELDELWSLVRFRKNKRWVWLAQCVQLRHRRTRQVAAYAAGRYEVMASWTYRSEVTCRLLWERVPAAYKRGLLYTDFWSAYALVGVCFGRRMLRFCPKNSIGPWAKAFVRRTLSFSKCDEMHGICLLVFLHQHNRRIQIILNN